MFYTCNRNMLYQDFRTWGSSLPAPVFHPSTEALPTPPVFGSLALDQQNRNPLLFSTIQPCRRHSTTVMQIFFHTPGGEKCPIQVPEDGTVVTLKALIMTTAGSALEEERLVTGAHPLSSIDHEQKDERPKSHSSATNSRGQSKRKSDRRNFIVRLGGVVLEDGYFLTHYKITDGSVVHPEWESVDLAPTYSTAILSAVDPDWWNEAHRHTIENIRYGWTHLRWPTFEDLRQIGPDLIWPGPLVLRKNRSDRDEQETHLKPREEGEAREDEEYRSQYTDERGEDEEQWEEERSERSGRAPPPPNLRNAPPPPNLQNAPPPPNLQNAPPPPPKQRAPPPPPKRAMEEEDEEEWVEERQAQSSKPANHFVF